FAVTISIQNGINKLNTFRLTQFHLWWCQVCGHGSLGFDIPDTWQIAHIESISNSVASKQYQIAASEFKTAGKYPVVSQSKEYVIGYCDDESRLYKHEKPIIIFGDHTTIVKYIDFDFVVGADGTKIFEPNDNIILTKFFGYVLEYYSTGLEKVGGYSRHYKYVKNKPFPIPPINEQERIIAKVEELLPYVDRYAESYEKLELFNTRFPDEMKKSILQYAIQGKLVEQRPEEGTADELYERIKKSERIKEITAEDIPFDIPDSWKWVRMGEIGETNIGLTYKPSDKNNEGTIVLRSSNIQNGSMDYADIVKVRCDIPERAMISKGDLLICARNGSRSLVGKAAIVDKDGMAFGAFMAKFSSPINPYIYYFLQSPIFRGQLDGVKTETINQITQDMLKNQLIPLPPLEEQQRIVSKLQELLPYCERLAK
ncbi:restriction endonuclease subunit S, partial [Bariatricus sp. HCP28S3_C2]|uniref:restriction endonuclease subunit S n=1 Tax=unclassified Bariatricus TaxID=2677046 RepID=UPI003F89B2C1